jgi:hypothetical protein
MDFSVRHEKYQLPEFVELCNNRLHGRLAKHMGCIMLKQRAGKPPRRVAI